MVSTRAQNDVYDGYHRVTQVKYDEDNGRHRSALSYVFNYWFLFNILVGAVSFLPSLFACPFNIPRPIFASAHFFQKYQKSRMPPLSSKDSAGKTWETRFEEQEALSTIKAIEKELNEDKETTIVVCINYYSRQRI
jgi:hypothetical protein